MFSQAVWSMNIEVGRKQRYLCDVSHAAVIGITQQAGAVQCLSEP
jgi:hypothetical protein